MCAASYKMDDSSLNCLDCGVQNMSRLVQISLGVDVFGLIVLLFYSTYNARRLRHDVTSPRMKLLSKIELFPFNIHEDGRY